MGGAATKSNFSSYSTAAALADSARPAQAFAYETYEHQLRLYLPSRVALVLARG